jgi:hypothetical protein
VVFALHYGLELSLGLPVLFVLDHGLDVLDRLGLLLQGFDLVPQPAALLEDVRQAGVPLGVALADGLLDVVGEDGLLAALGLFKHQ